MRSLLLMLGLVLVCGCQNKQIAGGSADGERIYKEVCQGCHGPDGELTEEMARTGVKSVKSEVSFGLSDADLRRQIEDGSENRRMPPYKEALSDSQITGVMSYLRSLSK